VKDLHPRALGWNACSMLYGYACQEGRRRGFQRIITYTRPGEPGTSLLAAGFVRAGMTKGGPWQLSSRSFLILGRIKRLERKLRTSRSRCRRQTRP
jgi:hypothetical protein